MGSKAEHLFNELGFKKMESDNKNIYYTKMFGDKVDTRIIFNIEKKEIVVGGERRNWWVFDEKLQIAIDKQRNELKWSDVTWK